MRCGTDCTMQCLFCDSPWTSVLWSPCFPSPPSTSRCVVKSNSSSIDKKRKTPKQYTTGKKEDFCFVSVSFASVLNERDKNKGQRGQSACSLARNEDTTGTRNTRNKRTANRERMSTMFPDVLTVF